MISRLHLMTEPLSEVAQAERARIPERAEEGRLEAKANGGRFGRKE